jgi:hypothetical protein
MLIGFSKYGTGSAARPIDYLTAETVHTGTTPAKASAAPVGYLTGKSGKKGVRREPSPVIVRGNPDRIKTVIDSIKFKNKYSSGVLSFSPNEIITPDMEEKIIKEFEQAAFAGLSSDRYEILWVRHQHTKAHRHELHFLTPRIDLVTGKSLNIAPPRKATRQLFDTLRSKINAEYGLADPDDPARARKARVPDHRAKLQAAERDASKIINLRAPRGTPNPARAKRLELQLQKLVERRASYHRERYPSPSAEPNPISPIYDRTRTTPVVGTQAPRIPISGARPAVCRYAGQFEQATQRWNEAQRNLEISGDRLGCANRAFANNFEQTLKTLERRQMNNQFFRKYGIPARPLVEFAMRDQKRERDADLEPAMTMERP